MRSINECQAEVFRRSEKRIKECRRRRNHMLLACIPFVLCITIFGAFMLTGTDGPTQKPETTNKHHSDTTESGETAGLLAKSVEVTGNGIYHRFTSDEEVREIVSILNQIVAVPETNDSDENEDSIGTNSSATGPKFENTSVEYIVFVENNYGSYMEYRFTDSSLIDEATQEEFYMNEDTCHALSVALGIPLN